MKDVLGLLGWVFAALGLVVLLAAFALPSASAGARVVSYELLNAKMLFGLVGAAFFVSGSGLVSASAVLAAIERQTAALRAQQD